MVPKKNKEKAKGDAMVAILELRRSLEASIAVLDYALRQDNLDEREAALRVVREDLRRLLK